MEEIFVADSYKNFKKIGEPFINDKGKKVIKIQQPCSRCGGLGFIVSRIENGRPIPIPVDNGVCYKCNGTKVETKIVRAYTEKEYNTMSAAKMRAAEKRAIEKEAREKEAIENAAIYKHEVAKKLGFGEDEKVYLVYGDNTYAIKDKLKEMGARFDPTLKWYFSKEVELPEGYNLYPFSFDELYEYHPITKWASFRENAKDIVKRKMTELKGPSTSVFYPGEEKDRIYNITAKVSKIGGFQGYFGYTMMYTFTSEDYVFVWMTSKNDLNIEVGKTVDLTGTIKKFEEYAGVRNTYLTRCIVKPIE